MLIHLQDNANVKCFQYTDNTTIYDHAKISDLNSCRNTIYKSIYKLSVWSKESTLAFNNDKTKVMILSTPQMSRVHHLDECDPNIAVSGYKLGRIKSCKLLGVHINEHLKWDDHIKHTISGCYATLSILRKLKYLAKYELRKQLAETLILSKLDYANLVFYPLPQFLLRRLQRVQFAAASFVLGHYVKNFRDVLKIGWLPINERRDLNLLKSCFKALHWTPRPGQIILIIKQECPKELRSSNSIRLVVPTENGTLQDNASKLFNNLPETIRNCIDYRTFLRADVCKYQPEVCNSEKLKILKKIHNIAHGKLLQEIHVLLRSDNYFWCEAIILNSPLLNRVFCVWHHMSRRPCFQKQTSFVPNEKHPVW